MDRLLSNHDIEHALGGQCLVLAYHDLDKYGDDIMGLLDRAHGRLIVLYEEEPGLGHWISIVRGEGSQRGRILYTDPYGKPIDYPLERLSHGYRLSSGQADPKMSHLLGGAPAPIQIWYNELPLQGENSATCGRWAILRCMMPHLSEDRFYGLFQAPGVTPDELAVLATEPLLPPATAATPRLA
jgi:hypothetical protein